MANLFDAYRFTRQIQRMQQADVNFLTFLRISADSREELRPQDVDRVMTLATEEGHGEAFRDWLLGASKFVFGTQSEIESWTLE